jgi:hypothetical protein
MTDDELLSHFDGKCQGKRDVWACDEGLERKRKLVRAPICSSSSIVVQFSNQEPFGLRGVWGGGSRRADRQPDTGPPTVGVRRVSYCLWLAM